MIKTLLKFLFSKEIEVAPNVFWLGGYLYENRNQPTTPRPLKFKKRDTPNAPVMPYNTLIHAKTSNEP